LHVEPTNDDPLDQQTRRLASSIGPIELISQHADQDALMRQIANELVSEEIVGTPIIPVRQAPVA
jgi:hypothetical protein